MRVAYFTAGTIGAGHHVRGFAIARAVRRLRSGPRGAPVEVRIFAPEAPFRVEHGFDHETVEVRRDELRDPERASASTLAAALRRFAPRLVVVDMFWAPLRYVLPALGCEAWLLVRSAPASWLVGPDDARFDASQFTRVIAIEPLLDPSVLRVDEVIDPIVIANPDECRPRSALRARLGVPPDERLEVVTHAGRPGEHAALAASPRAHRFDLADEGATFPLAEWLGGADHVVSGAGYNAFWEAHWLGYAHKTTFHPFARPIDDQAWRVRACLGQRPAANGADTLAQRIAGRV